MATIDREPVFQQIEMDGRTYEFPTDMTDEEIAPLLQKEHLHNAASREVRDKPLDIPRGIANNNPLNIEFKEENNWKGQTGIEKRVDPRFTTFEKPEDGIRAGTKILQSYAQRGQNTVRSIIFGLRNAANQFELGWTSPMDRSGEINPSEEYVQHIVKYTGFSDNTPIDVTNPVVVDKLFHAMVRFENGGYDPYEQGVYDRGIASALGTPEDMSATPEARQEDTPEVGLPATAQRVEPGVYEDTATGDLIIVDKAGNVEVKSAKAKEA